jgi:hypothetical protein
LEDDDPGDPINLVNLTGEEWDKTCEGVEESLLQYAAHHPNPDLYRMMRQVDSGRFTVGASVRWRVGTRFCSPSSGGWVWEVVAWGAGALRGGDTGVPGARGHAQGPPH